MNRRFCPLDRDIMSIDRPTPAERDRQMDHMIKTLETWGENPAEDYVTPAQRINQLSAPQHGIFTWKLLAFVVVMAFVLWMAEKFS